MSTTYAQKQAPAQKKDAPSAASVFDASSQSESLQRKADMANNAAQRAEAPRPNNTGMPDNLKSGIESFSGFSMDDVRVHYNSSKPATVQALAYTQGTDIHVAPGQEKHLPHEAWHVAQQMAGRVSPTTNINGMPVNDNAGLEHEADVMGEKAVQCKEVEYPVKKDNKIVDTIQCSRDGSRKQAIKANRGARKAKRLEMKDEKKLKEGEERRKKEEERRKKEEEKQKKNLQNDINKELTEIGDVDAFCDENADDKEINVGENAQKIRDNKYWIDWPEYATGDLPSMSAAILMGFPYGIKVNLNGGHIGKLTNALKNSNNKFNQFLNAKDKFPLNTLINLKSEIINEKTQIKHAYAKLEEVASYLGCSKIGHRYAADSSNVLKATLNPNVNPLSYESEIVTNNVRERGKKFSWLTRVVATGTYKHEGKLYEEHLPDSKNKFGLKDFNLIKRAWFNGIYGEQNVIDQIKDFLNGYRLNKESFKGRDVEVLWIRTSGASGGAHYENDTSFRAIKKYIDLPSNANKFFILAGNDKNEKAELIAKKFSDRVVNLTRFWEKEEWKKIAKGNRAWQFYVYEVIKEMCKGNLKHIGSMSGGLEALALIGHNVEFKAKDKEWGVGRVDQYKWMVNRGVRTDWHQMDGLNSVAYTRRDFFDRGGKISSAGYEKRAAKYYNLFTNCRSLTADSLKNNFFEKIGGHKSDEIASDVLNEFFEKRRVIVNKSGQTNGELGDESKKLCIEMAKLFAKIEKYCIDDKMTFGDYKNYVDTYVNEFKKIKGQ